ncbi:MAG: TetR family transcriptional regulator [Acidimicrobiia bacterium]|nr:TetR family transcriptional regulator [Acidimicrobiia bacterium]
MVTDAVHGRGAREIEIIRSAYRVMARRGSHRLSLQDIADEAGVSKGLLLYHFGSKDNLLLESMQWALERTAERILKRMASAADSREALGALIEAVFVSPEANRDFYLFYLDLVEHLARVPSFSTLSSMLHEKINGLYAAVIETGRARGIFAVGDVDIAARNMRALIEGTFLQWLQTSGWRRNHRQWRDDCQQALIKLLSSAPEA